MDKMKANQRFMFFKNVDKYGVETGDHALSCLGRCAPSSQTTVASSRKNDAKVSVVLIVCIAAVGLLAAYFYAGSGLTPKTTTTSPTTEVAKAPDLEETRLKAERGDAEAQKNLGKIFVKGDLVKEDYKEAAKWYLKSAEQGFAPGQVALAELYEAGRGVPQDNTEAAKLYQKAAEQGYAPAQYNLAVCYVLGQGVPPSQTEATKWYRKAADQGDDLAQYNLGMRYSKGIGVAASVVDAYQWLSLAVAKGLPDAVQPLSELKQKMTREQISEGQRRVEAFAPKKTAP